jgi:hypothetical protein
MSDTVSRPSMIALNFKSLHRNSLQGFFDLQLASGLVLRECSLHKMDDKEWVGLPGKPQLNKDGTQRVDASTGKKLYVCVVDFADKATRERFRKTALAAVHALLGQT